MAANHLENAIPDSVVCGNLDHGFHVALRSLGASAERGAGQAWLGRQACPVRVWFCRSADFADAEARPEFRPSGSANGYLGYLTGAHDPVSILGLPASHDAGPDESSPDSRNNLEFPAASQWSELDINADRLVGDMWTGFCPREAGEVASHFRRAEGGAS